MVKKLVKIIAMGVLIIMSLGLFTGCNKVEHNAVLYDNANEWIYEDFLKSNWVRDAKPPEEWLGLFPDPETLPEHKIYIVDDSVKFDEIFAEFPCNVNFEKEILVIYITTNIYMENRYKLKNLKVDDGTLKAEILRQNANRVAHTASAPQQRCFVIKMDKQNMTDINININNK